MREEHLLHYTVGTKMVLVISSLNSLKIHKNKEPEWKLCNDKLRKEETDTEKNLAVFNTRKCE